MTQKVEPLVSQRFVFGQFVGMGNFNALITATNVNRLIIEDCQIGGSGSNGLAMWGCTAEVRNNEFGGNFLNAIYAADGWGSIIADNFVHDDKNNAIFVGRQTISFDGTIVRNNRVHATGATWNAKAGQVSGSGWLGNAIYAFQANDIIISENVCLNSAFSGVRLLDCWNCSVIGNQIYQSGEIALMWECPMPAPAGAVGDANPNRYEGGVLANNVVINGGTGISVTNGWDGGRRVSITGNHVKSIVRATVTTNDPNYPQYQTTAAGIVAENDCVVTGNIVEDCPSGPGIVLVSVGFSNGSTRKSADLAVGNTIKSSQIGIGFFKDAATGYTLIANNVIDSVTNGAIVPITLPAPYYVYTRIAGSTDYGVTAGGLYTGKPFANVMIGQNFAI